MPASSDASPREPSLLPPSDLPLQRQPAPDADIREREIMYETMVRWFSLALPRLFYRLWRRIGLRFFPADSRVGAFLKRCGIRVPGRLDISWIDSFLAVGGRFQPEDVALLAQLGITGVVDARAEASDDRALLAQHGIQLLHLSAPDTYPLSSEELLVGAYWINRQRDTSKRVLVHCKYGVGRSIMLCVAALVLEGYPVLRAYKIIGKRRWQAALNRRQMLRLLDFAVYQGAQITPDDVMTVKRRSITADALTTGADISMRTEIARFGNFLLVGGSAAIVNLGIIALLTNIITHWTFLLAAILATEVSLFYGFLLNDRTTFRSLASKAGNWWRRLIKFHSAYAVGQTLTIVLSLLLIHYLKLLPLMAQATSIGVVTLFNFTTVRFLAYRPQRVA